MEPMNILFDINHPAHVHFFRNAISALKQQGHRVWVSAREKEMTTTLLRRYRIPHLIVSRMEKRVAGLAKELILHQSRVLRIIRREAIDVVLAIGGTFMVHACKMLGIPSLVFYDTENAKLQNAITYPFASKIYTPTCYEGDIGPRQIRYAGYHELAYLHPNQFTPDPSVLDALGVGRGDTYTVVRFVGWGATHDLGHSGLTAVSKRKALKAFGQYGPVFITSEKGLPEDLRPHALPIPPDRIHDALYYASLCYGESATMASESCVLGTPAVYIDNEGRGYTNEQEKRYGAVFNFTESPSDQNASIEKGVGILADPSAKDQWALKRNQLLAEKIDVTEMIIGLIDGFSTNGAGAKGSGL
jgi:predicted glycosyltransferase